MEIEGRESGLALIVTLLLGLIAAAFIGALMYIVTTGSWISGMEARYTSSLQAAKGGASYIMQKSGSFAGLQCDDGSSTCLCSEPSWLQDKNNGEQFKCNATSSGFVDTVRVDLGQSENLGDYDVDASLLSRAIDDNGSTIVYSFEVIAQSTRNTNERSKIEFVFKENWNSP